MKPALTCSNSEHLEQAKIFEFIELNIDLIPELDFLFAIPNAGRRGKRTARKFKKEGLKKGVPDLFLAMPTKDYPGLFIEMKYGKNKTSESQNAWLTKLKRVGYKTAVCYSAREAIKIILNYLNINLP